MIQIVSYKKPYIELPCERCGSKKKVLKTWKETVATFSGKTTVEYTQIVCTNAACQKAFDESLQRESERKEVMRLEKEERDNVRKASSLLQANKSHKNKSRI